ncbi:hypothetical protein Salat_1063000 [Sesamum alatum]|uniref:DUF4219 domain-containing protein n=1 Tax=Sesamum alatum TaxID=300844 RepID=A0AAE2CSM6_9LAMI|nr:hypothetical protein Salat_1063000 [Sesamum alatum]
MGDLQVIGGIKKLNNNNYNSWSTCIMSYMQGQDLWEVVNGNETTIEEDVLEHIRESKTPKEAWDTFAKLFSKKNDTKLQLIESELLSGGAAGPYDCTIFSQGASLLQYKDGQLNRCLLNSKVCLQAKKL